MTTMPAFTEPRLPKALQDASRRLLASALGCRIAIDIASASEARRWALEVIRVLDEITPAVERPLTATSNPQQPPQLSRPAI